MQLEMPLTDTPRARRTDPATSHQAADRIKDSGALGAQQHAVLALVRAYPGCTSAEIAMHYAISRGDGPGAWREDRPMTARRLPELSPVHVRKGEPRECTLTGSQCLTWWPR